MTLPNVGNQTNSTKFVYDYQITSLDISDPAGQSKLNWRHGIISFDNVGVREIKQDKLNDFMRLNIMAANGTQISCSYCSIQALKVCSDENCTETWNSTAETSKTTPVIMNEVDAVKKIQFRQDIPYDKTFYIQGITKAQKKAVQAVRINIRCGGQVIAQTFPNYYNMTL